LIARYQRVVVDIGTGTGQAVLRRARREPLSLVIGVDTDARAMADASRRAAANFARGGVPNAIYLAESAERLPGALAGRADQVTVVLPWGSLLRGLLGSDPALLGAISDMLRPGGEIVMLLDQPITPQVAGLELVELRPATASDVAELSSAWGQRLGIPRTRPAWIIRLRR
jgi:16S rRNA (adenine(1408)-N(1))-methyltransferase